MSILNVLSGPWAILPEKLIEIQAVYDAHLRGEKVDIARLEARLGRELNNEPQRRYEIRDGVAVIPIEGVMARRMNLFSQISGGVSTELVARDIRAAAADPAVHSIVELYDSPGGAAEGLQLMIDAGNEARSAGKRVVSLANGTMASGAYWTGSAAEQVYIADAITQVGSIGVVATHRDNSGAQQQAGVHLTDVVAGKYKRIASSNGPLSDEGRQTLQQMVDYLYSVFVSAVATHRHTTVERVLADMADGRVFIGEQAISAGLVDGISTLDQLVMQLNRDRTGTPSRTAVSQKGNPMAITREQITAEAPELLAQIQAEAAAGERARIQAVEGALIPGHEALIASLKFDGKTTGGDAALAVNSAERALRIKASKQLGDDAPNPVPQAATPTVEPPAGKGEDMNLPVEERCKASWESDSSLRAEFSSLDTYTAYRRAEEAGRVRRLGKRA